jgi:hypothetical protein
MSATGIQAGPAQLVGWGARATTRGALYALVSPAPKTQHGATKVHDQNPDVQEQPLRDLATQRGWQILQIYSDRASGAKKRRPGIHASGRFGVVVVWRLGNRPASLSANL